MIQRYLHTSALLVAIASCFFSALLNAAEETQVPRIDDRFHANSDNAAESPDFRRHVVPLMGRLGCNGRACHGSFQGQGDFRLSLFGYDFKADHENLLQGEDPRVNIDNLEASLFLQKPLEQVDHGGGQILDPDSWQLTVLKQWIEHGAKGITDDDATFIRLDVAPREIVAQKKGQTWQLKATAVWSDGTHEDVTPLCRFRTNNDQIADIDEHGFVTAKGPGDSHVVAFYDNGVVPVPVIFPVSDKTGSEYPDLKTPTPIDELVAMKLRKLGEVPSEVCSDGEFLRRASLDITGTLPPVAETEAFLSDTSPNKRDEKIEELLERPGYAAWWATKLCDWTMNNNRNVSNNSPEGRQGASNFWYQWMHSKVAQNLPYDEIVEGIVLAKSRLDGESYTDFCERMSSYLANEDGQSFGDQPYLPYFWSRQDFKKPEERALGFAYTFLGVRIQCAQCHKHPFDQWTKDDFDRFKNFFNRVTEYRNGSRFPDEKSTYKQMLVSLDIDTTDKDLKGNKLYRVLRTKAIKGKTVPFTEIAPTKAKPALTEEKLAGIMEQINSSDIKQKKKEQLERFLEGRTATVLGGKEMKLEQVEDPREILLAWMLDESNPYFTQAIVNRVWSSYFNIGIVEPPDDLSLANPPSNPELLEYLAEGFREHNFDMKWLHREICKSDTYQRGWKPNETNLHDDRNFGRAVARRMPAEVIYDAVRIATAGDREAMEMCSLVEKRAIADTTVGSYNNDYALEIFGQSTRESNCDCDRSMEPSLLQTVFLQNDKEMLDSISRRGSWLDELKKTIPDFRDPAAEKLHLERKKKLANEVAQLKKRLAYAMKKDTKGTVKSLQKSIAAKEAAMKAPKTGTIFDGSVSEWVVENEDLVHEIIESAYLRTLVREPTTREIDRSITYLKESPTAKAGIHDILWALLNTKEFALNH
jgi:phosphopantetheinyl transferase (holo-ACP synthase)